MSWAGTLAAVTQHRPKSCDGRTFCPYSAWRGGSPRPASIEKLGPYVRTGEPRFRCKLCRAAFFEPSHLGAARMPFGRFRVHEALIAHLKYGEEMAGAARRLGVEPRTAYRWLANARASGAHHRYEGHRPSPRSVTLHEARWFRRTGRVKDAPYAVDGEDLLAYHRACIGELGFLLLREGIVDESRLREWEAMARNASATKTARESAIKESRRTLFKARPNLRRRGSD